MSKQLLEVIEIEIKGQDKKSMVKNGHRNGLSNGRINRVSNGVHKNGYTNGMSNGHIHGTPISIPQLIAKKRDGRAFSEEEIAFFVDCVVNHEMQNSQLGALLMAIYLRGMSLQETIQLTRNMKEFGDVLSWPEEWNGLMADKHSTGGVGDKVSLPLAPALAACGVKVPMISGRGLGFTGGTLDKLESINGFNVSQSVPNMKKILSKVGCCIVGQTETLVPADKIMYATRDVTSTTDSTPLIAASIISKKAAENLSGLVLDVKYGKGAFLKTYKDAKELAKVLVDVSSGLGTKTTAVLSNMNNPLGKTIGNALEVAEAIHCLQGDGPKALRELVVTLGGQLLNSIGKVPSVEDGMKALSNVLDDGSALEKFLQMIIAQGTPENLAKNLCTKGTDPLSYLPKASYLTALKSSKSGFVNSIDALACAEVSSRLGAGRTKAGQEVDLAVGLQLHVEVGDVIHSGDNWITVHHNSELSDDLKCKLEEAILVQEQPPLAEDVSLIKEVIPGC